MGSVFYGIRYNGVDRGVRSVYGNSFDKALNKILHLCLLSKDELIKVFDNCPEDLDVIQYYTKDSFLVDCLFIINLDLDVVETWVGSQLTPQTNNRYGQAQKGMYYPCKRISVLGLDTINDRISINRSKLSIELIYEYEKNQSGKGKK